jgi:long-chain acyl-CoA synthetase
MDKRFYVDESRPWFKKEAGWPDEVPKNLEFPRIPLGEMLRNTARKYPDAKAIYFLDTWVTWGEVDEWVDHAASALHSMGLRKGDVVTMLLPNSIQYVIGYYACQRLGLIASGINPTYKPAEVLHQVKTVGTKCMIVLDSLYESCVAPIREKSGIETMISTNVADMLKMSILKKTLGKLLKKIPTGVVPDSIPFMKLVRHPISLPKVEIDPEKDIATYIMTGGTTGVPKAAILSHFNCVSNAVQSQAWLSAKAKPGAGVIGIIPLFHSFAHTCVMNISVNIGTWMLLFPRPPATEELLQKISELAPPEGLLYVGAEVLFKRLADFPNIGSYNLAGKLTLCVSGAGPLHRPVQEAFEKNTGGKLVEGYGLSECSPVVSAGPFWGYRKIGTIGLPFPGTEWKIVDSANYKVGKGMGNEENMGELAVAGPQVMVGYLNRPEETADTIVDMDGKKWCLTGDIGYMDSDGQVVLRDRKKQLIKHKGFSVYPKEVEELVGGNDMVSEVAVAGIPDEMEGEVIKAWVVLKPDSKGKITEEQLLKWCKDNMTHYKVPAFIQFIDELPKTLVGKVLRRELQEADPIYQKRLAERKAREAARKAT